jgi:hypothetical protein
VTLLSPADHMIAVVSSSGWASLKDLVYSRSRSGLSVGSLG